MNEKQNLARELQVPCSLNTLQESCNLMWDKVGMLECRLSGILRDDSEPPTEPSKTAHVVQLARTVDENTDIVNACIEKITDILNRLEL